MGAARVGWLYNPRVHASLDHCMGWLDGLDGWMVDGGYFCTWTLVPQKGKGGKGNVKDSKHDGSEEDEGLKQNGYEIS